MTAPLKIDFVSDVSCPWCVIGLKSLQAALARLDGEVSADLHFQPFELNPQMPAGGQDVEEHLAEKFGSSRAQMASGSEALRARGAALGFDFQMEKRDRIYNTFDAHRLLHWAETQGRQQELKLALFDAYFTQGQNPSDPAVLTAIAAQVGLDPVRAQQILASDEFVKDVREREEFYRQHGIQAVPSVIVNDRHLIQGGQPVEVFEQALRKIAAEQARAG